MTKLKNEAIDLFSKGKLEEWFDRVGDEPLILKGVGNGLLLDEEYDISKEVFERYVRKEPKDAAVHYNLGRVYEIKKMVGEALREFRIYLKWTNPWQDRVQIEEELRRSLSNLDDFSENDLGRVLQRINEMNGTVHKGSIKTILGNFDRVKKALITIWQQADIADDLIIQIFDELKGTAAVPGFLSNILFLKNRQKYNICVPATMTGLENIGRFKRNGSISMGESYIVFNTSANKLRREEQLHPETVDWLLWKVYDLSKMSKITPQIWTETTPSTVAFEEVSHLVYKISWHPGGYKGGFCGDAHSTACEAFGYVRKHKEEELCSPTVFHCVDEDKAFADSGWRVKIHPPRIQKLHELAEGKSLVFLAAPLTKSKTRYRLVGFYTIDQKVIENGNVVGLFADRKRSSKFDLEEQKLVCSNTDLKNLFGIQNWTARRNYDFISSENALNVVTKMYEIHKDKKIVDPDIDLTAMKNVMESLRSGARVGVEKEKYAILWSANISLYPDVIEYHQEHIRRVGATYWGVGFPIDTTRFSLPINGYLYTTDSRKVTHIARIEDIEAYGSKQMPKEPRLRPPEYKDEIHRSYFRISKLERLPVPIEVHNFQQWNGERVIRPPQNYVLVIDPKAMRPEVSIKSILGELIENEPGYSEVIKAAFAHLIAGKNLVIYGPPATSKTYLAKRICEHACEEGDFCFHTANAEWSYFDIVGGLILQGNQTIFKEGILLKATEKCKNSVDFGKKPCWLIIDELNRANLDLAFGKIFTQLDLDYRDRALETAEKDGRPYDYFMPLSFRILATMNTYDRALLFSLGYAFMRRFAFIPLESLLKEKEGLETEVEMQITEDMKEVLESETIKRLKEKTKQVVFNHFSKANGSDKAFIYDELEISDKDDIERVTANLKIQDLDILDILLYVSSKITNEGLVEIGHAIVFDAAKFIVAYSLLFPEEKDPRLLLDEVVISYLLPQLEYFMPKLRKGRIFEEEKYRASWEKLTQIISSLSLPKTSRRLKDAAEEFKVIR